MAMAVLKEKTKTLNLHQKLHQTKKDVIQKADITSKTPAYQAIIDELRQKNK